MHQGLNMWLNHYLLIRHTPNGRKYPYLDCWGLVIEFYRRELGIELDDYTDFSIKDGYEKETSRNSFREITADEAKFGDVIAFFRHGQIFHVGVKLTKGEMLHTGLNRHARVEKIKLMQFVESRFFRHINREQTLERAQKEHPHLLLVPFHSPIN